MVEIARSFADIPAGTQTRFKVLKAEYKEDGRFGPEVKMELDSLNPEHPGMVISSASLSRPRLDKVDKLRKEGLSDKVIAETLREKGFKFKKLDEPDKVVFSDGSFLYKVVKACHRGDMGPVTAAKDFTEMAQTIVNKTFVATTRKDKNDRTRLDGKAEVYPDMDADDIDREGPRPYEPGDVESYKEVID